MNSNDSKPNMNQQVEDILRSKREFLEREFLTPQQAAAIEEASRRPPIKIQTRNLPSRQEKTTDAQ